MLVVKQARGKETKTGSHVVVRLGCIYHAVKCSITAPGTRVSLVVVCRESLGSSHIVEVPALYTLHIELYMQLLYT